MLMMQLIEPENAARADGIVTDDQPTNAWLADVVCQGSRLESSPVERAATHALEGLRPAVADREPKGPAHARSNQE